MESRIGRFYTRLARFVFTFGLLFLLVNLILAGGTRLFRSVNRKATIQHFAEYGDKVYEPYASLQMSHDDVETLQIECFQRPVVFDSFTQFRERPIRGRFVNVNAAGFRDSKNNASWPPLPANFNLFVFGGSSTFGYGVPDGETIPANLQRVINAANLTRPVMIYNFGAGFYFSTQERILFEQMLLMGIRPDAAVFIDGLNDSLNLDGEGYHTQTLRKMMERRIASRSFFLADPGGIVEYLPLRVALDPLINKLFRSVEAVNVSNRLLTDGPAILDRYEMNQKIIRDISQELGINVLFVWQPVPS